MKTLRFIGMSVAAFALFFGSFFAVANAQERDGNDERGKSDSVLERVRDRISDVRENIAERLSEARVNRIAQWWERVEKRLGQFIERLHRFSGKVEDHIVRLENAGVDVSESRAALREANAKIDVAAEALREASAQVDDIIANNEPREAFAKLHELQKGVVMKIREAHRALAEVLSSLRDLPRPNPTATPDEA